MRPFSKEFQGFVRRQPDPFANPVGGAIREVTEAVFEALLADEWDGGRFARELDQVVRIGAVQDIAPSQAAGFTLAFKGALRQALGAEAASNGMGPALQEAEARLDAVALQAFDLYLACREKIYELRVHDIKRGVRAFIEPTSERQFQPQ